MIMKKILMLMAIMAAVISLSSCGSLENNEDCLYSCKSSTKNKSCDCKFSTKNKSCDCKFSTKNKSYDYEYSHNLKYLEKINKRQNSLNINIYNKAKERLRYSYLSDYMDSITNEKVIVSNDSICTISFIHKYLDNAYIYPTLMEKKMEYTLFKVHKGYKAKRETEYYETIFNMEDDIDRHNSIEEASVYINFIGNIYDLAEEPNDYLYDLQEDNLLKKTYDGFIKKGMSKENAKDKCLYVRAMVNLVSNRGRRIFED